MNGYANGRPVLVEVVFQRDDYFNLALPGRPDDLNRHTRDRIRAALLSSDIALPQGHSDAYIWPSTGTRQISSSLDLPMVLALLAADGQIREGDLRGRAFVGQLGLDGSVRPFPGGFVRRSVGVETLDLVVPRALVADALSLTRGTGAVVRAPDNLAAAVRALRGEAPWPDLPDTSSSERAAIPRGAPVAHRPRYASPIVRHVDEDSPSSRVEAPDGWLAVSVTPVNGRPTEVLYDPRRHELAILKDIEPDVAAVLADDGWERHLGDDTNSIWTRDKVIIAQEALTRFDASADPPGRSPDTHTPRFDRGDGLGL